MIRIKVKSENLLRNRRLVEIAGLVKDRTDLNSALGENLEDQLVAYFQERNLSPNKRGWPKQGWWAGVAEATQLDRVDAAGAEVNISHSEGFGLRLRGGTVTPRNAKALTIPMVPEAYGKRASVYESETGNELFRARGMNVLAVKDDFGRGFTNIYALVKKATIPKDDEALPDTDDIETELAAEAEAYLEQEINGLT